MKTIKFDKRLLFVVLCVVVSLCACVWYGSTKPSNELFEAVENRDIDAVKEALKTVDINATDAKGRTAIMVAAKRASSEQWSYSKAKKNLEIIEFLIDNGADLSIEDEDGLNVSNYIQSDKFTYWKIWDDAKRDKLENTHWHLRARINEKLAQASM